jgi:hypothetical protein
MDVRKVWLLAITVGMTAHVFAQEPTPAQPAAATAPTPAAPATPAEPAAKPADSAESKQEPAKSAAREGELTQETIMAAQKAGYEIRNENGQQLVCRRDNKTGSRLRHTFSCMTPKQWDQLQSDTAQSLRSIERRRVGPNNN